MGSSNGFRREPRRDRGRERDRRPTEYSRTFCQSLRGGRQPEPGHHPATRCEIAHRRRRLRASARRITGLPTDSFTLLGTQQPGPHQSPQKREMTHSQRTDVAARVTSPWCGPTLTHQVLTTHGRDLDPSRHRLPSRNPRYDRLTPEPIWTPTPGQHQ